MRAKGLISRWLLVGAFCVAALAGLLASGCGDKATDPGDDDLVPGPIVFETYRDGNEEIYVKIAFTTERHTPNQGSEVYTINIDGTEETRITTTTTWNLEPSWPGR